jgi:hypothetical protein
VKKLTTGNQTFVPRVPRFGRGRLFDAWPKHAVYSYGVSTEIVASGRFILYSAFQLKDGQTYHYPSQFFATFDDSVDFVRTFLSYHSANGYVGWFGEWFNGVFIGLAFDKVNLSEWDNWKSTH